MVLMIHIIIIIHNEGHVGCTLIQNNYEGTEQQLINCTCSSVYSCLLRDCSSVVTERLFGRPHPCPHLLLPSLPGPPPPPPPPPPAPPSSLPSSHSSVLPLLHDHTSVS